MGAVRHFLLLPIVIYHAFAGDALDTWTVRSSGKLGLHFVTHTSELFIAGGEGGSVLTSQDGVNWSKQSLESNTVLRAVTSDGSSNFVAVGSSGTLSVPTVFRSSNGREWAMQEITLRDFLGNVSTNESRDLGRLGSVAYAGGSYFVGGNGEQGSKLFYSLDLTNWHAATPWEPPSDFGPYYSALVPARLQESDVLIAAGTIWAPVRLGTMQDSPPIWRFEEVHRAGVGYIRSGAYGNGILLVVGMEMAALVSTNGRDWTTRRTGEPLAFPNQSSPDYLRLNYFVGESLAFGNGTFVACCGVDDILVSTNGIWTKRVTGMSQGLRSIAFGAGRFVAAGGSNIVSSAHISTPGLSIQREVGAEPKLRISGEIGREYLLERSPDLSTWTAAGRSILAEPRTGAALDLNSSALFYRVSLVVSPTP